MDLGQAFFDATALSLYAILLFFVPLWGPQVAFWRPAPKSALASQPKKQYSVSDGFVLTVYLATANGLVAMLRNEVGSMPTLSTFERSTFSITMTISANLFVLLMWVKCLRFMRCHSIVRQRSQLLTQILLYPISVIGVAGMLMNSMMLLLSTLETFTDGLVDGVRQYGSDPFVIARATLLTCSTIAVVLVRYVFKRFIVIGDN